MQTRKYSHNIYYNKAAIKLLEAGKKVMWVHINPFGQVPPYQAGSYNYLIYDILQQVETSHLYIGSFQKESWNLAQKSNIPMVLLEHTEDLIYRVKRRFYFIKLSITRDRLTTHSDGFIACCAHVIKQFDIKNIILWGSITRLQTLRSFLPNNTIAFAQRHYDYDLSVVHHYNYCDLLVTQTPGQAKLAFTNSSRLTPLVEIIPNGVETEIFKPLTKEEKNIIRKELAINSDSKVLIFPSKIVPHKGASYLKYLIEYYSNHQNIHFLVCGSLGDMNLSLKNGLKVLLENKSNVTWLRGITRTDMIKYYQCADVSLMPALCREGFSMAGLESLSSGLPVIATDTGSYSEIITNGKNGFLCSVSNLRKDLIRSINLLTNNEALLNELSANARRNAVEKYPRKKVVQNFIHFFACNYNQIDTSIGYS